MYGLCILSLSSSSLVSIRYKELCHGMVTEHVQKQVVRGQLLQLKCQRIVDSWNDRFYVKFLVALQVNLLDMLVQVPLVFSLQVAERTLVDDILMFGLNVFLHVTDLSVLVVTEVALVLDPLVLPVDVPLERALVNGDEVTELAVVSHPSVD